MTQEIREIAFIANGPLDIVFNRTGFPGRSHAASTRIQEHGCSKKAQGLLLQGTNTVR
jgi:hypothetical protein